MAASQYRESYTQDTQDTSLFYFIYPQRQHVSLAIILRYGTLRTINSINIKHQRQNGQWRESEVFSL
ncbi:MAG: hypothetical protein EZS28_056052 [Streblomastix strix]|uniref:Uncharacterized protein n=1 Tax=Streblomastix strix TaxID=222440 RepID=A0A5J4PQI3_9EUKA|nr:MAG: hypothetical protein EZS28_056052 [Streblomastix strix]